MPRSALNGQGLFSAQLVHSNQAKDGVSQAGRFHAS